MAGQEARERRAVSSPDAALLGLCARLADMQAEWQRLWLATSASGPDTPADVAWYDYSNTVWPLLHNTVAAREGHEDVPGLLLTHRAVTPEGLQAKAAAVLALDEAAAYCHEVRDDGYELGLSLIRDAAGIAHRPVGEEA